MWADEQDLKLLYKWWFQWLGEKILQLHTIITYFEFNTLFWRHALKRSKIFIFTDTKDRLSNIQQCLLLWNTFILEPQIISNKNASNIGQSQLLLITNYLYLSFREGRTRSVHTFGKSMIYGPKFQHNLKYTRKNGEQHKGFFASWYYLLPCNYIRDIKQNQLKPLFNCCHMRTHVLYYFYTFFWFID